MKQKKLLLLPIISMILIGSVFAHQPRLARKQPNNESSPIIITNPEISQAFYGILSGEANYYQIYSTGNINFYTQLTTPIVKGTGITNIVVEIINNDKKSIIIDGNKYSWTGFFEPFAGDKYLQGPEFSQIMSGNIIIKISNQNNQGRYSFVVGKIESFPFNEIINTYKVLPELKMTYFQKSFWSIFYNYVGFASGLLVLILAFMAIITVKLVKYFIRSKKPQ